MAKKRRVLSIGTLRLIAAVGLGIAITTVICWRFSREVQYQRKQAPAITWNTAKSGNTYWWFSVRGGVGWLQVDSEVTGVDLPETDVMTIDRTLAAPVWSTPASKSSNDRSSFIDDKGGLLRWRDAAAGWPMLAMRFSERTASTTTKVGVTYQTRSTTSFEFGHRIHDRLGLHNILPLRPIWPGFFINAAIFTVPSYLLLALIARASTLLARSRRKRKGLCISCGYDLSGLDGVLCPECGNAQSKATIEASPSDGSI